MQKKTLCLSLSTELNTENCLSHWKASKASERVNYQLFLTELCDLLASTSPGHEMKLEDFTESFIQ